MEISVPFRLNTEEEILSYINSHTIGNAKRLLRFCRTHKIEKPVILSKIRDKIDFVIMEVKKNLRAVYQYAPFALEVDDMINLLRTIKDEFLKNISDAPKDYFQVVFLLREHGYKLLKKIKKQQIPAAPIKHDTYRYSTTQILNAKSELYSLLVELLKNYLNTKDNSIKCFLKKSISLLLVYNIKTCTLDKKLIEHIQSLPDNSSLLLEVFYKLFYVKIDHICRLLFQSQSYNFTQRAKNKIMHLTIPANLKHNIIAWMNKVEPTIETLSDRHKLERVITYYKSMIDIKKIQKIKGIIDNFSEKLKEFNTIFNKLFYSDKLKTIYNVYQSTIEKKKLIQEDVISTRVLLTLYPCKDYHDLLKGYYSHDCTTDSWRASQHLLNKRFFNIRIFKRNKWIGNIYMLDYTDKRKTLIIDRIQISKSEKMLPIKFFQKFMEVLTENLLPEKDIHIISPPHISNFPPVQSSYYNYAHHNKRISFRLDPDDSSFECYGYNWYYVLN